MNLQSDCWGVSPKKYGRADVLTVHLTAMSKQELKNLIVNARRLERRDVAIDALRELTSRGQARASDYTLLEWNQETVRTALVPFAEVARTVPDNQRTAYTEAGGRKIGRSRGDPEWMWVDSYSAIKTPKLNAVFVGYVPRPGDDAYFVLLVDGETIRQFEPAELDDALGEWKVFAQMAIQQSEAI